MVICRIFSDPGMPEEFFEPAGLVQVIIISEHGAEEGFAESPGSEEYRVLNSVKFFYISGFIHEECSLFYNLYVVHNPVWDTAVHLVFTRLCVS